MIKTKLTNLGKDIFTVIDELTQNSNIINLARISPDMVCPQKLTDLAIKHIKNGLNQYVHADGLLGLREAISEKMKNQYRINYCPINEITITAGATQAIYTTISTFIGEGDEVVLFEPAYSSYVPAIVSNGGRAVFVQLKRPNYYIDWEEVQKIINSRTKLIIVNTPHNPTGAIFTEEDVAQLRKITNGTKIMVLSDESFEHLVFDKKTHHCIAGNSQLAERSIIISSFGKTFNIPGWKIGYCMAPEKIMSQIRKAHTFQINSVNAPLQYALAEYVKSAIDYRVIANHYEEKRNLILTQLMDSRFELVPSRGTFYQLLDYKSLSDEKDTEFARKIMDNYKVALFPLSVFYHDSIDNKILGLSFACENDVLTEACLRLKKMQND